MIPSAAKMPLPASAPARADLPSAINTSTNVSTNGDSRSDNDTPSFAAHLDQFVTPARPLHTASSSQRSRATVAQRNDAPTAQNADKANKANKAAAKTQASTATQGRATSSPADTDAHTLDDAGKSVGLSQKENTDKEDKQKEEKQKDEKQADQDTHSVAANPMNTLPLPLTPANLAITNGIAPVPVPVHLLVQQVNDTPLLSEAPASPTPVSISGASLPVNPFPANPLNLPGVPMDSRAAVQTAAPGVVNALPQNAVTATAASAQVPVSTLPVSTLPVSTLPVQTAPTASQTMTVPETITDSLTKLPTQTAPTTNSAINNAASTPQTPVAATTVLTTAPVAAPPVLTTAPIPTTPVLTTVPVTALPALTTVPAAAPPVLMPVPVAATTVLTTASVAAPPVVTTVPVATPPAVLTAAANLVQQMIAQQTTTKQANAPLVASSAPNTGAPTGTQSVPNTGSVSQETAGSVTVLAPDEKVPDAKVPDEKAIGETGEKSAEVSTTGASTTGISTTEQNLGDIERLFTLGANKNTDTKTTQAAELETTTSDTSAAPSAPAASLLTPSASGRQQIPVSLVPQVHLAATANNIAAASLPLAAVSTPVSDPSAVVSTPLVAVALAAGVTGANNALPADSLRTPGGTVTPSSIGSTTGADSALFAPVGAQAKTGDTSDGETRDDSRREEAASAENKTDSAAQANSAGPFNSLQASGDAAATNAITAPNGSSQIARTQIVEQVTRHLESMRISNGEGEVRLRLSPANLGNVQISVARHQEGVVARIAVESAQIQQAMDGAKEHLRATLEARGLRVSSVEVTVTPNQIGNDGAAFAGQRNWQPTGERAETLPGSSRPNNTVPVTSDGLAPVSAEVPVASVSQSRLDYRA